MRREERDTEEDEQRAEPHPDEDLGGVEPAPEEPVAERREAGEGYQEGTDAAVAVEAARRERRHPRERRRSGALSSPESPGVGSREA